MYAKIYELCFEDGQVKAKWTHAFRSEFDAEGVFSLKRVRMDWEDNSRVPTQAILERDGTYPLILYDASIVHFAGTKLRVTGLQKGIAEKYTLQSWEVHLYPDNSISAK